MLETQDRFGKHVTGRLPLQVVQAGGRETGDQDSAICWPRRTGKRSRARNSWRCGARVTTKAGRSWRSSSGNKIIQRFWTEPGRTQQQIKLAVTEAMRGGFTLHVTQVRENRAYLESRKISVPWKNKELDADVGTFHVEVAAGPEGNLDGGRQRAGRGEIRGGNGGGALRRIAGRLRRK